MAGIAALAVTLSLWRILKDSGFVRSPLAPKLGLSSVSSFGKSPSRTAGDFPEKIVYRMLGINEVVGTGLVARHILSEMVSGELREQGSMTRELIVKQREELGLTAAPAHSLCAQIVTAAFSRIAISQDLKGTAHSAGALVLCPQ